MKRFRVVIEVETYDHETPEEVVEFFEDLEEDWSDMGVFLTDIAATVASTDEDES